MSLSKWMKSQRVYMRPGGAVFNRALYAVLTIKIKGDT